MFVCFLNKNLDFVSVYHVMAVHNLMHISKTSITKTLSFYISVVFFSP